MFHIINEITINQLDPYHKINEITSIFSIQYMHP